MWKKIKNYRLSLKDLKFMLWLFGITCFIYSYNFIIGLAFVHKFQIYDLGGAIATFAAFMDTRNRIKNKNYKAA
ncbi:hypothetical protein [Bacillus mycoides]|uniref:Uncharacterized protein n=1 Tax=Bacillus mycoides TaxID=1405 RepID=A0AAP7W5M5_BACMY|nr:hypothetical protein [Bacillus mycoides]EJS00250.1 hypothetical protein IKM_04429 [Bacillus mycoides]ETT74568.1 hypothetical protein C174_18796 [Bacillus mycoides FSL H7-687]MED0886554.1 hypothetical protein [Bacillus mycoides]MED0928230.1 hypothetical protein [Bacillus mycoides]MED0943766.1 hypothetical protein [Bacillus mycoides]